MGASESVWVRIRGLWKKKIEKGDLHKERKWSIKKRLFYMGRWRSGQSQQTVNLPTSVYGGSNPSLPTKERRENC